jgi:WD40 repeat protein
LSPDGKRYALKVWNLEDNKGYLIVDGQKVLEADYIGNAVFSQDSQKIAYDYRKNLEDFLVFDNKERKIDCAIPIDSLLITKDNNLVYLCVGEKEKHYLIFKDEKFGPYDVIFNPSPPTNESENLLLYPFKLSDDHNRIAFKAKKGRKEILVIDGKEKLSLEKKPIGFFLFHPNKKDILYTYRDLKSNKFVLLENNKIKMRASWISSPIFSKDLKKIAYYITKGKLSYMVLNHKVYSKPYSSILDYKFSPDSKHLVFVAIKGKKVCLVIDKKESCKYNAVEFFDPIQFSEDGQKVYIGGLVDNKIVWDTYELK